MKLIHPARLVITALLLAWSFDQLFWEKAPGVSFLIFVLLCLAAGFFFTWSEMRRPAITSLALLIPILYFATMSFLRAEPFTRFINFSLASGCLLTLALTWRGGRWWLYNLADYLINFFRLAGNASTKPVEVLLSLWGNQPDAEHLQTEANRPPRKRTGLAILLGLALALPLVTVLAALLAAADPIFSQELSHLLEYLRLEKLGEYLFRLVYVLIGAYLLGGIILYALFSSDNERFSSVEQPWPPPFLSWVATVTTLLCINLLFIFFVTIQFRYFFGGQANITMDGFTYAEYARRGFGELVGVAMISLLILLTFNAATRRETSTARIVYSSLTSLLVALVMVILVSAFQRLLLYEAVYGFTRLRTYTHIFIIWLAALLLATSLLEWLGKLHHFVLAFTIAVLGFGATLNLLNVDSFIARQNIARTISGEMLDIATLASLSSDAVPALFELFHSPQLALDLRKQAGASLVCKMLLDEAQTGEVSWLSFTYPPHRARQLFQMYRHELTSYKTYHDGSGWMVEVDGQTLYCQSWYWMD